MNVVPLCDHDLVGIQSCGCMSSLKTKAHLSLARLKTHVQRCVTSLKENQPFNESALLTVCGSKEELFSGACCLVNDQERPRQQLHSQTD